MHPDCFYGMPPGRNSLDVRWARFSPKRLQPPAPSRSPNLIVGDLVGQQRVHLRGLGGGVAEPLAHDLDAHAGGDEFGGVGVPELVDVDVDPAAA